jgi:DNA helicase II / ATP-dependent DNA helicase PcrA
VPVGYSASVDLERELNPQQAAAVRHGEGPLLVLAGAGSGKTRVITYRIARLIGGGVAARELLAVTFTNKAAGEMRERAEKLLGTEARGLLIGTFHSICARLLRQYGEGVGLSRRFVIYDEDDSQSLVRRILTDFAVPERVFSPRDVCSAIDRAKNSGVGPADYETGDYFLDLVGKVYPEYERRLAAADAVDFGGLLLKMVELLRKDEEVAAHLSGRLRHVLVDEFQDTNQVQYELVRQLSATHHNLCVVGDDDQSIYGWRGADVSNILGFERDHPGAAVIKLEQNYRSTQVILDAATAVISRLRSRKPKTLWTDTKGGEPITLCECDDERAEARFVFSTILGLKERERRAFGDFAVFYRTHAQSRVLEEALRSARPPVPYVVVGGVRFYDRAEVKDLLAYLKVLTNPADDVALLRIINSPTRGIGTGTIDRVAAFARATGLSFFEAARRCAGLDEGQGAPAASAEDPAAPEEDDEGGAGDAGGGGASGNGNGRAADAASVLKSGPKRRLGTFIALMSELARQAAVQTPAEVAENVLERTGYLERLSITGSVEAESRRENLMELLTSMRDYEKLAEEPDLVGFLETVTLASDVDGYSESEGRVTLMTVHSAKGLEFPIVFIIGLEQGIFPHQRALNDTKQMEEEHRLAYVAITRARQRLLLSFAQQRWIFGQQQGNPPSEFLRHLPSRAIIQCEQRSPATTFDGSGFERAPWEVRRAMTQLGRAPRARPGAARNGGAEHRTDEVWVDGSFAQGSFADEEPASTARPYKIGMRVRHAKFGEGEVRAVTGMPPNQNLTIYFPIGGPKTIRSRFVELVK